MHEATKYSAIYLTWSVDHCTVFEARLTWESHYMNKLTMRFSCPKCGIKPSLRTIAHWLTVKCNTPHKTKTRGLERQLGRQLLINLHVGSIFKTLGLRHHSLLLTIHLIKKINILHKKDLLWFFNSPCTLSYILVSTNLLKYYIVL